MHRSELVVEKQSQKQNKSPETSPLGGLVICLAPSGSLNTGSIFPTVPRPAEGLDGIYQGQNLWQKRQ
jgi:hypothetical protein